MCQVDLMNAMQNNELWTINSKQSLDGFIKYITELYESKHYLTVKWTVGKQRTNTQNNALQVYCRELANALNDAGLDMKKTLKAEVDIPWTQDLVREHLWKPIQEYVIGKRSTTEANTFQYSEVYDVLNRNMAEKFGVSVPFPSRGQDDDTGNIQADSRTSG